MNRPLVRWVFAIMVLVGCAIIAHKYLIDGLDGVAMRLAVGSEDTFYSPGYSASGFRALRTGMDAESVLKLIGEPIERMAVARDEENDQWLRANDGQFTGWSYSSSPSSSHYRWRVVILYEERVVDTVAGFYWD